MVDGSLGEATGETAVVETLARSGNAVRLAAFAAGVHEVDAARRRDYALLPIMLARAPDRNLLEHLTGLPGDANRRGAIHAVPKTRLGQREQPRVLGAGSAIVAAGVAPLSGAAARST